MKRIVCVVMALLLLTVCGCAEKEAAVVYPTDTDTRIEGSFAPAEPLSFGALCDGAAYIVCGEVTSADSEEETDSSGSYHVSYAHIAVKEMLKGELSENTIVVRDNGKVTVDENKNILGGATVCGGPLLQRGHRVVLFLTASEDTHDNKTVFALSHGTLGKFYYDRDGLYHCSMLYSRDYQNGTHGGQTLTDMEPKTLDEIKALING